MNRSLKISLASLFATVLNFTFVPVCAAAPIAPGNLIAQELWFRLSESRTTGELLSEFEAGDATRAELENALKGNLESPLPYSSLKGSKIILGTGKERWVLDFTKIHEHVALVNSKPVRADRSMDEILRELKPSPASSKGSSLYKHLLPDAQAVPVIPIVATGAMAVALIPGVSSTLIQKGGEMYDVYFAPGGKARVWESDADKFKAEVEKKGLKLQKFTCENKKLATVEYSGQFGATTHLRPTYENGRAVNIKRTNRSNAQGSVGSDEQYFLNSDERVTSVKSPGRHINQSEPTPLSQLVRPFPIERAIACCTQEGCESGISRALASDSARNPAPVPGGAIR